VRDPWGIRPLCIGLLGDTYMLASESCAFDLLGAKFVRDVHPGEIITLDKNGMHSTQCPSHRDIGTCLFEYVYFARPDSDIDGMSVYQARFNAGRMLARLAPVDVDIVAGVPDSAIAAAQGYALESCIPYGDVLVKNRYIGRTFIQPGQQSREFAVKLKLSVLKKKVEGKRVLLVDDSIVRGTSSIILTKMVREAGAKEVHMRISSPPVRYPCHFGINTPTQRLLIGASNSVEELRVRLGLDSLAYLSLDLLEKAVSDENRSYCSACFDGKYPIALGKCRSIGRIDNLRKE
jgi:amidophosphoribosyltransferase